MSLESNYSKEPIEVSVVVVTWQSADTIENCLASVRNSTLIDLETIIIDNGSADSTASIVRNNFPNYSLVETGANLGFAPACNIGIARARGRFVLLLNPDAVLEKHALAAMVAFLLRTPHAVAVAPVIDEAIGEIDIFSARALPTLRHSFYRQLGIAKLFPRSRLICGDLPLTWGVDHATAVTYLGGAVVLVRGDFLAKSGCLDTTIPMYFEDLDLAARIARAGLQSYVLPEARARHIGAHSAGRSRSKLLLSMLEDGQAPWLYFRRYRGGTAAALFRVSALTTGALRTALLLVIGPLARAPNKREHYSLLLQKSLALTIWALLTKGALERRITAAFYLEGERHLTRAAPTPRIGR